MTELPSFGAGPSLAVAAAITGAIQLGGFALVVAGLRGDFLFDLLGSLNFVAVTVVALLLGGANGPRAGYLSALVLLSRAWLGAFLQWRVCSRGSDKRVDDLRKIRWVLALTWTMQALWVFLLEVPVILVSSATASRTPLGAWDAVGVAMFAAGFALQVAADLQKAGFRADPANKDDFCQRGLWRFSRHPNFLGEIVLWWGILVASVPVLAEMDSWSWLALCSPLYTMLLLIFVSGLPFAEGKFLARLYANGRGELWEEYCRTTPPICMLPCGLYAHMPSPLRALCCCEFAFLRYSGVPQEGGGVGDAATAA